MASVKEYLSLVKFSHTVFALPFALIGFFLATNQYGIDWQILVFVILCMVFARSAAMAFNRFLDRDIDLKNPRTANVREIPNGTIKASSALIFVIINCAAFVASTYFINTICLTLSPLALFIVLGYSYTKRFTALCHLVLGLGLSLSPLGAYLAVTNQFEIAPFFFSVAVLFWVSGFDIIYALQDEQFDSKNGLNSIPVLVGRKRALIFSRIFHFLSVTSLMLSTIFISFGILFWIGVFVFSLLLIYQHLIISENDLSRINIAFFTTNGIASVIFGLFVILDLVI